MESALRSFISTLFVSAALIIGCSTGSTSTPPDGEVESTEAAEATPTSVTPIDVEICTERDCGPTLLVRLQGAIPDDFLFVAEAANGRRMEVHCINGIGDYGPRHFDSMSYLECRNGDVQFINFSPDEVTLHLTWDEGAITRSLTPQYRITYPNGEDCPPECRIGEVVWELTAQ